MGNYRLYSLSFVLKIFQTFLYANGICHFRSVSYHPTTNGAAKNVISSFKNGLKLALLDNEGTADISLVIFMVIAF